MAKGSARKRIHGCQQLGNEWADQGCWCGLRLLLKDVDIEIDGKNHVAVKF